eukprot:4912674-Prymnesium_polylepis.1
MRRELAQTCANLPELARTCRECVERTFANPRPSRIRAQTESRTFANPSRICEICARRVARGPRTRSDTH